MKIRKSEIKQLKERIHNAHTALDVLDDIFGFSHWEHYEDIGGEIAPQFEDLRGQLNEMHALLNRIADVKTDEE